MASQDAAAQFRYFSSLPTEIQLMVWKYHREAEPPVRHYFQNPVRRRACIYSAVDARSGTIVPNLATEKDPRVTYELGPLTTSEKKQLQGPLLHNPSGRVQDAIRCAQLVEKREPVMAYMDLCLDIVIFEERNLRSLRFDGDHYQPYEDFVQRYCPPDVQRIGFAGVDMLRQIWLAGAGYVSRREPQDFLKQLIEQRVALRTLYLIVQPDVNCPYVRNRSPLEGCRAEADGFIDFYDYYLIHQRFEPLITRSRSMAQRAVRCTCLITREYHFVTKARNNLLAYLETTGRNLEVNIVIEGSLS
ncbi:hypothetical protein JX266_006087 [Neoarthrinium moseri]|nr:hypothetical protein JX266_006087 [Neoarthrinium moseri]